MNLAFDVLNLADSGFPTGAHGHAAGLEYAVQAGWISDRLSFAAWARSAIARSVMTLDLRAAVQSWSAGGQSDAAERWQALNADVAAFRTSRVQREASAQVGRSFLRSVVSCYGDRARGLPESSGFDSVQAPVAWGAAFRVLGLPVEAMAETLVFGALRQWTMAVIRVLPLGQKDAFAAQTEVLAALQWPDLEEEAAKPLETFAPGLELAGLGQENLARKYFRS